MNKILKRAMACAVGLTMIVSIAGCDNSDVHKHDYYKYYSVDATCEEDGANYYKCITCGETYTEKVTALGHAYAATSASVTHLLPCTRSGCLAGIMPENNDIYSAKMVYTFDKEEDTAYISALYAQILQAVENAGTYSEEDVYEKDSALYQKEEEFEELFYEFYNVLTELAAQVKFARLAYDLHSNDQTAQENYQYISDYRNDIVQDYYEMFKLIYASKLRNYFYYGWTEDDISEILSYSETTSDETTELTKQNTQIELEFNAIDDIETDDKVAELYAQFVENNNRIAQIYGYDNYIQYAYDNVYSRDYSYQDIHQVADYMKEYLPSTIYRLGYSYYRMRYVLNKSELSQFASIVEDSFFDNVTVNTSVNNFFDGISVYGTINYSQIFENLINNGNYFTGDYDGAYTTYVASLQVPLILYGDTGGFTIVHEFGHYTNAMYNKGDTDTSLDLLETHSQGLAMIYLSYLMKQLPANVAYITKLYKLYINEVTLLCNMAVNMFEEAVYTGEYSGTNSEQIMSDGKITSDEYDLLYKGILIDFGIEDYSNNYFWRYITINQPCYYVSYSISLLSSLQLYMKAQDSSIEDAVISHNKLINYTDDNPDYTYSQVLEYAGLTDFKDEQLFVKLQKLFTDNTL